MKSIIEIHVNGNWHDAASIESGGRNICTFEYLPEYVFGDICRPVSLILPVSMETRRSMDVCPSFLLDMVPQGNGRRYLTQRLELADSDDLIMPLIQHGAFNPVGRLRLDSAVAYTESVNEDDDTLHRGFTLDDIVGRKDDFIDNLSRYGMLGSGTTGLQGASAKFMLVKNKNDLWYIDSFAKESDIGSHWLMKLPRGKHETDISILKNEAAYIKVARACGLRSHGETFYRDGMLFVPRFDRLMRDGKVVRLHQESLASLADHRAFGVRPNHFDLVNAFLPHVSNPVGEVIEYIKRDLLNMGMRNTDNHARNTAIQQLENGVIQLTPVFDIAPMFKDREMIPRASRWLDESNRVIDDFADVISELPLESSDKNRVMLEIKSFSADMERLPLTMAESGVDEGIIDLCKPRIDGVCKSISRCRNTRNGSRHNG